MKTKSKPKRKFTAIQRKNLAHIRNMERKNTPIDLSDLPEVNFSNKAQRGLFYRPQKTSITIRIDQDILDYYRSHASNGRYQTEINNALRRQMSKRTHGSIGI